jgi:hypothetical protein
MSARRRRPRRRVRCIVRPRLRRGRVYAKEGEGGRQNAPDQHL